MKRLLPVLLLLASSTASAAIRHTYCLIIDFGEQAYYFSDVFEGEYGQIFEFGRQYRDFVATQARVSDNYQSLCFAKDSAQAARQDRLTRVEQALETDFAIHGTGWQGH